MKELFTLSLRPRPDNIKEANVDCFHLVSCSFTHDLYLLTRGEDKTFVGAASKRFRSGGLIVYLLIVTFSVFFFFTIIAKFTLENSLKRSTEFV